MPLVPSVQHLVDEIWVAARGEVSASEGAQRRDMKRGQSTKVMVDSSLIKTWMLGPAVSLKGSPTVSPGGKNGGNGGNARAGAGRRPHTSHGCFVGIAAFPAVGACKS